MKVVVCLSTIPSRMEGLPYAIRQIQAQTFQPNQIYLYLPKWSKREKREYPLPPEFHYDRLKIIRCEDYGPITKLYPVLEREKDPETIIITLDDDIEYPNDTIEKLVFYCQLQPDAAIGGTGFTIGPWYNPYIKVFHPNKLVQTNIIEGFNACAYRRKFFDSDLIDYKDAPEEAFYHDDVWISGYLSLRGIPRLVCPGINVKIRKLANPLSGNMIICTYRFFKTVNYLRSKGAFSEHQNTTHFPEWAILILLGLFFLVLVLLSLITPSKPQHQMNG